MVNLHAVTRQAAHLFGDSKRLTAFGVVVLVSVVAGLLLLRTHAATPSISDEPESGSLSGQVLDCPDMTASASRMVLFGKSVCPMFTNPVKTNTADPGVLRYNNRYYMVSTAGTPTFRIYVSDNLVNWQYTGKDVFNGTHPWGGDRFWAPELHIVGDHFAVYYSAFNPSTGHHCVGVATASALLGPYTDLGRPLVSESTYGVIDVNFLRDDDGRQYLYWKENEGNTRIFSQELTQAGTSFIGSRTVVLQKGLAWEGTPGIEGPWVMKKNGLYYLFYSGEFYSTDKYSVGVAKSTTPMGTYTKKGPPILVSGSRWKGPGHNSIVSTDTTDYMVYHAWDGVAGSGSRDALVDKITWSNGWPSVANGTPTQIAQPYPL